MSPDWKALKRYWTDRQALMFFDLEINLQRRYKMVKGEAVSYRATSEDQLVGPESTIRESWERFDAENPHVYDRLVALALRWTSRREGKLGIGMLFERLRWDLAMETTGEPLKLNNNYRALYAREMMEREPALEGLFETRRLRADEPDSEDAPSETLFELPHERPGHDRLLETS